MHNLAFLGSDGHEKFLHEIEKKPRKINNPDIKIYSLIFDIKDNAGITVINPAKVAPIPSVTIKAGSAQHNKVPNEVNKVNDEIIV